MVTDMLIRIKNANMAGKETILVPLSQSRLGLAKLLKKQGVLKEVGKKNRWLKISVALGSFRDFKIISRSGQRIYAKAKHLPVIRRGFGIISTSEGLMTDKEAREKGLGGEVICQVK